VEDQEAKLQIFLTKATGSVSKMLNYFKRDAVLFARIHCRWMFCRLGQSRWSLSQGNRNLVAESLSARQTVTQPPLFDFCKFLHEPSAVNLTLRVSGVLGYDTV